MRDTRVSLNEAVRKKEIEEAQKRAASYQLNTRIAGREEQPVSDLIDLQDEYLREGLFVLSDLISKIG